MDARTKDILRRLPRIDELVSRMLGADEVRALGAPRWAVVSAVRAEVAARRQAVLANSPAAGESSAAAGSSHPSAAADSIDIRPADIARRITSLLSPSLCRVINATGVVLHTNLGRAPLSADAIARIAELAAGYSNLEYQLHAGSRGSRHGHLTALLTVLTGAEDAVVVNNNAGAVMLALMALAAGREVVVSRGELVEIGGSFRIPDVMRLSGADLVEVGTTNKTRAADYQAAIGDATGMLLKVHPSNFAIVGFTEEVGPSELAAVGRAAGVLTMMDLGSGALVPASELAAAGLAAEPSVGEVIAAGIDLVTFSGDKLLGGPQAGILCGRREAVDRVRRHPLMRALRPDKLCLAALEATLTAYRDGRARAEVPALAMLTAAPATVRERAAALLARTGESLPMATATLTACESRVGGGAMPLVSLPSFGLLLAPGPGVSAEDLAAGLRAATPPVVARVSGDQVILDLRTVADDELDLLAGAVAGLTDLGDLGGLTALGGLTDLGSLPAPGSLPPHRAP